MFACFLDTPPYKWINVDYYHQHDIYQNIIFLLLFLAQNRINNTKLDIICLSTCLSVIMNVLSLKDIKLSFYIFTI